MGGWAGVCVHVCVKSNALVLTDQNFLPETIKIPHIILKALPNQHCIHKMWEDWLLCFLFK